MYNQADSLIRDCNNVKPFLVAKVTKVTNVTARPLLTINMRRGLSIRQSSGMKVGGPPITWIMVSILLLVMDDSRIRNRKSRFFLEI